MDPQHSDQSLFLYHQQQKQRLLYLSWQSHQRLLQLEHHRQQQQLLKAMPQQMCQIPQQFQPHNMPIIRPPMNPIYEPNGMCAMRLINFMHQQQHRPEDNNIEFWREFVAEFFAPNARKKLCFSMYESAKHKTGVFSHHNVWRCEICNHKAGHGFEASVEVLPRLFKVKYESGILEELLHVDTHREYQNSSGHIVLDCDKAIKESVFEKFRVVHDGHLRILFTRDLKICSWEFCARRHEVYMIRRTLIPMVNEFGAIVQTETDDISAEELQNNCNRLVASTDQLAKTLEVPLIDDYLGYAKSYVRCLQISQVANSMKDLIDYSREKGIGPMVCLAKFPRRMSGSFGLDGQVQQHEDQLEQQQQQMGAHNPNGDQNIEQASAMQIASANGVVSVNNSINSTSASTTTSTV